MASYKQKQQNGDGYDGSGGAQLQPTVSDLNARLAELRRQRGGGGYKGSGPHHGHGHSAASARTSAYGSRANSRDRNDRVFGADHAQRQVRPAFAAASGFAAAVGDAEDDDDEPPFDVHHRHRSPPRHQQNHYQQQQQQPHFNEEDILTEEELACLRVIEIEHHVRVLAQLPTSTARARHNEKYGLGDAVAAAMGGPSSSHAVAQADLTVIGDDAIVKIYPRHVVLTRAGGGPLVEFVIAELSEIIEREEVNGLDFVLKQRRGGGGGNGHDEPPPRTTVIQIQCPHEPSRSAIYKIVCAKRTQLARDAAAKADLSALASAR